MLSYNTITLTLSWHKYLRLTYNFTPLKLIFHFENHLRKQVCGFLGTSIFTKNMLTRKILYSYTM